ncbi:hypothetical protein CEY16_07060 [Halalkalibacillus sediminis]|uniref:DUF4181 domain-containing protein n=1 Tax=Halalkalibacillus sediminis TaxID=2018042 RepID=A0A2I0QTK9_9BACI|nr:DUF4181 domain-containing protein [Halalkalibacillus sediminis]PKR77685.1 hypothetical protein CEY16_07060 [Halalkalibacillus sediminis]
MVEKFILIAIAYLVVTYILELVLVKLFDVDKPEERDERYVNNFHHYLHRGLLVLSFLILFFGFYYESKYGSLSVWWILATGFAPIFVGLLIDLVMQLKYQPQFRRHILSAFHIIWLTGTVFTFFNIIT